MALSAAIAAASAVTSVIPAIAPLIATAAPALPAVGGALAAGGGGLLAFLAANPLTAAMGGIEAVLGIRDLFSKSPADRAAEMQAGVTGQLIPQLQRQAAGLPTAATQAQMGQLQQQATRMGQSYAASAQRQGIGGGRTTPGRAQQGRVQAAQLTAQGNILGQAQLSAQQQLLGIGSQGLQAQQQQEAVGFIKKQALMSDLGDFMSWYKENKADEQADRFKTALFNWLGISA